MKKWPSKRTVMKTCRIFFLAMILASSAYAEGWKPTGEVVQIPVWPASPPGENVALGKPETSEVLTKKDEFVAGKTWTWVTNVSLPTLTFYPAKSNANGSAIMVFPGGGFAGLAIDLEGTEICDWANSKGMSCILLKYRVPHAADYWGTESVPQTNLKVPAALQDAQRAIRFVRSNAAKWKIDPHKIGVIGFSAGGYLVAQTSNLFNQVNYPIMDDIDKMSARPDFAIALYPGHLYRPNVKGDHFDLYTPIAKDASPTMLVQSTNDPVDNVENSLIYYRKLNDAHVKVELHLFAEGGHAFGLRQTEKPITHWPELAEAWLKTMSVLP